MRPALHRDINASTAAARSTIANDRLRMLVCWLLISDTRPVQECQAVSVKSRDTPASGSFAIDSNAALEAENVALSIYLQDSAVFGMRCRHRACREVDWLASVGLPPRPGCERCGVRGCNPQGGSD